jgi:hypothetical protein
MADFLEDDEPPSISDHRFGNQEWDKLEENFVNVSIASIVSSPSQFATYGLEARLFSAFISN